MIIKWAEINHFTMVNRQNAGVFGALEPLAAGLNIFLYLFVAGLMALYYLLPIQLVHYECVVMETNLISRDIVALVYKVVFFVLCALMAVAFPYYARKLAQALTFGNKSSINKAKKTSNFIQSITLIASMASFGLFLQGLLLIYQTMMVFLNLSIDMVIGLVCAFVAEILPTLALMWTFRVTTYADSRSRRSRTVTTAQQTSTKDSINTNSNLP